MKLLILAFIAMFVAGQSAVNFSVDIPDSFKSVQPGDELLASFKMINLASTGRVDVFLEYWIEDANAVRYSAGKETVAVETQANFVRYVQVPAQAKSGNYSLHAKIVYADGSQAVASHGFTIAGPVPTVVIPPFVIISGVAFIALLVLFVIVMRFRPAISRLMIQNRIHQLVRRKK